MQKAAWTVKKLGGNREGEGWRPKGTGVKDQQAWAGKVGSGSRKGGEEGGGGGKREGDV